MSRRLPFRYLEPAFFGGLLDDPLLFVRIRPLKRALLFDCGQIAHLAKRVIKPIDTVFITHAHMDHIMGIPTLVRHQHAAPRPLDIFGPPGVAERIHHQLRGFVWNLSEPGWFTIRIHEVHRHGLRHFSLSGPKGFSCRFEGDEPRASRLIWSCRFAAVEAELLDHKVPVLGFTLREQPGFYLDPERIRELGLVPGDWIHELKRSIWQRHPARDLIVHQRSGEGFEKKSASSCHLYAALARQQPCAAIGYLCDVGWTAENIRRIRPLFQDLTLLCAECTFLGADRERARTSYHLCTSDLNELITQVRPAYLLPMHHSKSYLHRSGALYDELQPPEGTTILRLPPHLVPPPLSVKDVERVLRSDR